MNRKLLRIALPVLCIGLVQCTASTTTSSGPPTAFATLRLVTNAPPLVDGSGDNTFGPNKNSIVVTPTDPALNNFALALAIQPADGKIVVGGSNGLAGQGNIALIRYNTDGSLDTTFGGTGIVKATLGSPAVASAVAINQPVDTKIVVAALAVTSTSTSTSATGFVTSIFVLRYNPDGTPDTSFGTNGVSSATAVGSGLASDTCSMVLQSGKIVVAGATQDGKLVLGRYNADGTADISFGASGTTVTTLTAPSPSNFTHTSPAMAAQSDGRIIVVTRSGDDQAVLRYSANGIQDTGFGGGANNGIVVTDIGSSLNWADKVAIQSTGAAGNLDKIVVVGHTGVTDTTSDISLVRYSRDGVLDTTSSGSLSPFGGGTGFVVTDINSQFDNGLAVLLQDFSGAEPRILVSGNSGFGSSTRIVVLRYNADGTLDTSFGNSGTGVVSPPVVGPSTIASGNAIAIQPGLGIVVTGYD